MEITQVFSPLPAEPLALDHFVLAGIYLAMTLSLISHYLSSLLSLCLILILNHPLLSHLFPIATLRNFY